MQRRNSSVVRPATIPEEQVPSDPSQDEASAPIVATAPVESPPSAGSLPPLEPHPDAGANNPSADAPGPGPDHTDPPLRPPTPKAYPVGPNIQVSPYSREYPFGPMEERSFEVTQAKAAAANWSQEGYDASDKSVVTFNPDTGEMTISFANLVGAIEQGLVPTIHCQHTYTNMEINERPPSIPGRPEPQYNDEVRVIQRGNAETRSYRVFVKTPQGRERKPPLKPVYAASAGSTAPSIGPTQSTAAPSVDSNPGSGRSDLPSALMSGMPDGTTHESEQIEDAGSGVTGMDPTLAAMLSDMSMSG